MTAKKRMLKVCQTHQQIPFNTASCIHWPLEGLREFYIQCYFFPNIFFYTSPSHHSMTLTQCMKGGLAMDNSKFVDN